MHRPTARSQAIVWIVPSAYAAAAIAAGLVLPRVESRLWPALGAAVSASSATALYSTVAAGTMALTAIVFSLTFVMVQFSATAYSPRLVLWLARDPVIAHALGIFTATFLYAIAALAWVDRDGAHAVPLVSAWLVVALLVASIGMFIGLIQRIALLQIHRMLTFIGDRGREVIALLYTRPQSPAVDVASASAPSVVATQVLSHRGRPCAVQAVDVAALMRWARSSGGTIDVLVAVGDTVIESTPLLRVLG